MGILKSKPRITRPNGEWVKDSKNILRLKTELGLSGTEIGLGKLTEDLIAKAHRLMATNQCT